MPLLSRQFVHRDEMRCSFCHKSQQAVGKLISSPSDYPRAFICDECVAACSQIVQEKDDPFLGNPFTSAFFVVVEEWVARDAAGQDASEQLSQMRRLAQNMFAEPARGVN